MNDEQIKQRIRYLVEHGGLWEDPIADLRRQVRWLYLMVAAALSFHVIELAVYLVR